MKTRPILLLVFLAVFAGAVVTQVAQSESPQPPSAEPLSAELQQRRVAYRDTMRELVKVTQDRYMQGSVSIEAATQARIGLAEAELALATNAEDRLKALEDSLKAFQVMEAQLEQLFALGKASSDAVLKSEAATIKAEIALLEERIRQTR